jgi:hypothetical protein
MVEPVSVLSFHYQQDHSEEWVCVPNFLCGENHPDYLNCIRRNVESLEAKWGADAAQRILQCLLQSAFSLPVTCESIGLDGATHEYVIHEVLELLARRFVPGARFGGDTLFLHDVDRPPKWRVAKWIDTIRSCLRVGEHASLGVWPVMPVFAKIVIGLADGGRRPGWLPKVWDRLTKEERADVAGAFRNDYALAHISCTLVDNNLSALKALVASN